MPRKKRGAAAAEKAAEETGTAQRVDLLGDVSAAHAAHGARHDDFRRYRAYCTRRLRRIRSAAHAPCGKTRFHAPDAPTPAQTRRDPRHALLLLAQAERAWAHFMELKAPLAAAAAASGAADDVQPRSHYRMLRRVRKAAAWAEKLERLCADACDARTRADAAAYAAWMRGNAAMEHRRWAEAHAAYACATALCARLAAAADGASQRALMLRERIEETEPKLRFCLHNLRASATAAAASGQQLPAPLEELLGTVTREAAEERRAARNATVAWHGAALAVPVARVRTLLASSSSSSSSGGGGEREGAALAEAAQLLREAAAKKKPDPACRPLLEFVAWRRHEHAAARAVDAVHAAHAGRRPEELVRMYDTALQALAEAAAMKPGAPGAEQQEYAKQYAARGLSLQAERCVHAAAAFERAGKWAEADALLSQALRRVADARAHHTDCAKPSAEALSALDVLEKQVRAQRCIVQARAAAPAATATAAEAAAAAATPVADAPDVWSDAAERPLVSLDVQPEPAPVRPFLFNVAAAMVEFPNLDARKQPPKKGGFFGFWR